MAILTTQRFIAGLPVFDTYSGSDGTIVQMNLDTTSQSSLCIFYTGAYFVVNFGSSTLQLFTVEGKRVEHLTGNILTGVTLLTNAEKTALMGVGYPAN